MVVGNRSAEDGPVQLIRSTGFRVEVPADKVRSVALWDVTRECDLRCAHCYNFDKYLADVPTIDTELTTSEALEAIDRLANFGFDQIHFLGGEPLNRRDCLQLFKYATSKGLKVTVNSNGIRLTGDMTRGLLDAGVSQLAVSLDGPTAEINDRVRGEGSFARATKNLMLAAQIKEERSSDIQLGVVVTLTKPLLDHPGAVGAFFPLLEDLGVRWLNYIFLYRNSKALRGSDTFAYPMSMALEAIESEAVPAMRSHPEIYVQLDCRPLFGKYLLNKHHVQTHVYHWAVKCSAGHRTWLIEADGTAQPCGLCSSPDYGLLAAEAGCFTYAPQKISDTDDLGEIYNSRYFSGFREYLRDKSNYSKFSTCSDCEYFGDVCLPCPLYSNQGSVHDASNCIMEECEWSKEKLEDFYVTQEPSVPEIQEGIIQQRVLENGDLSIEVPEKGVSFRLSGVGQMVWESVNGTISVGEIVEKIAKAHQGVPTRQEVRRDVVDFLCGLANGYAIRLRGGE
jgi:MoaA/NifB/PqqE/SkfB family radical SAM enzyme